MIEESLEEERLAMTRKRKSCAEDSFSECSQMKKIDSELNHSDEDGDSEDNEDDEDSQNVGQEDMSRYLRGNQESVNDLDGFYSDSFNQQLNIHTDVPHLNHFNSRNSNQDLHFENNQNWKEEGNFFDNKRVNIWNSRYEDDAAVTTILDDNDDGEEENEADLAVDLNAIEGLYQLENGNRVGEEPEEEDDDEDEENDEDDEEEEEQEEEQEEEEEEEEEEECENDDEEGEEGEEAVNEDEEEDEEGEEEGEEGEEENEEGEEGEEDEEGEEENEEGEEEEGEENEDIDDDDEEDEYDEEEEVQNQTNTDLQMQCAINSILDMPVQQQGQNQQYYNHMHHSSSSNNYRSYSNQLPSMVHSSRGNLIQDFRNESQLMSDPTLDEAVRSILSWS